MAESRRCSICAVNWPNDPALYGKCAQCGGGTYISASEPLEAATALSMKNHIEFERFWEQRDADRQRVIDELDKSFEAETVDGPIVQTGLPKPKGPLHG